MTSSAAERELIAFRAAVLDGLPHDGGPLHRACRGLAPSDRTAVLGAIALRLHAIPGTEGAPRYSRESDGDTFAQIFDELSRRAHARWEREGRQGDRVKACEMWIRARAADRPGD